MHQRNQGTTLAGRLAVLLMAFAVAPATAEDAGGDVAPPVKLAAPTVLAAPAGLAAPVTLPTPKTFKPPILVCAPVYCRKPLPCLARPLTGCCPTVAEHSILRRLAWKSWADCGSPACHGADCDAVPSIGHSHATVEETAAYGIGKK
ncbi:hypothetical protein FF011L_11810 [Roseimaritima multifibrata]|uniref:Uncharacterized protein n=1 Tax=Roseimaritima multifibrata TaxID=1930274 RepID=A0A517MC23_9BACT|nr:hypothetical protein [Roseimaritima multifibrata]QDS92438.1 hypothetical protein FF011L_11810 [Roseimaritima multifibrata]